MDRNNYEVRDDGVYCCFNLHEKGLPCEYEKLSNEEIEGLLQEYRKEIYAKQAEIAHKQTKINRLESIIKDQRLLFDAREARLEKFIREFKENT
jgi:hypothetical protein